MSYLHAALRDAAVTPDGRGLMPLDEARAIVHGATVFERGEALRIGEAHVLGADRMWAALLSLEDAAEFVAAASRLRWEHPQRGRENAAPHERYGDAILPWLAAALGQDGRFPPNLWTAIPCLLRIGGADALAVVRRVRRAGLLAEWLDAHPEGFAILAMQAESGDTTARDALAAVADDDPASVADALGADRAARIGLPALDPKVTAALAGVSPRDIPPGRPLTMSRLSACVRNFELPMWDNANYFTGAMRVTAFASPGNDALVFQALVTGLGMHNFRVETVRVTADGVARAAETEVLSGAALYTYEGQTVLCVASGVRCEERTFSPPRDGVAALHIAAVDAVVPCAIDTGAWPPQVAAVFQGRSPEEALLVRLGQDHREKVFLRGEALARAAGVDADAVELFTFDGFQTPLAGQRAAEAPDFVAMVEALRRRLPIPNLPVGGHPLGNLYDRFVVPHLAWGDPRFLTG